jgi:hypothetical protein
MQKALFVSSLTLGLPIGWIVSFRHPTLSTTVQTQTQTQNQPRYLAALPCLILRLYTDTHCGYANMLVSTSSNLCPRLCQGLSSRSFDTRCHPSSNKSLASMHACMPLCFHSVAASAGCKPSTATLRWPVQLFVCATHKPVQCLIVHCFPTRSWRKASSALAEPSQRCANEVRSKGHRA